MPYLTRAIVVLPGGWRLSRTGNAQAAEAALEEALIYRHGIKQEFIRPHTPQHNGMVERLIRSVKELCIWLHNFASLDEARQALSAWFQYYNEERPHQALKMKTPRQMYKLAA
ncbi:MAG: transposase [Congregibacter sp.]